MGETDWQTKSLQLCLILCDPMGCSSPGSSVHGILQVRILEWVAMHSFKWSSLLTDWTHISYVSCIGRWVLYTNTKLVSILFLILGHSRYILILRVFAWMSSSLKLECNNQIFLLFSHPVVSYSVTMWTTTCQPSLSLTISQSLPKFMLIALVMSSHLTQWCLLVLLPLIFPSIRNFSNESSVHIKWPKYWSFSFSISPSSEYSGLISLKIDWFDLLAVQGTFGSLLETLPNRAFAGNFILCYIVLIYYWMQILLLTLKIELLKSVKSCKILPKFLPWYT